MLLFLLGLFANFLMKRWGDPGEETAGVLLYLDLQNLLEAALGLAQHPLPWPFFQAFLTKHALPGLTWARTCEDTRHTEL